jgi:hypothetical protein
MTDSVMHALESFQLYRGFTFQVKGSARCTRTALSTIDQDGPSTLKLPAFLDRSKPERNPHTAPDVDFSKRVIYAG